MTTILGETSIIVYHENIAHMLAFTVDALGAKATFFILSGFGA